MGGSKEENLPILVGIKVWKEENYMLALGVEILGRRL